MRQALVKIKDKNLISYNFHLFKEEEEIIIFSLTEFKSTLEELDSLLQESSQMADKVLQGQIKAKKEIIRQIGSKLKTSLTITESITSYNFQASLPDYQQLPLSTRKRRSITNFSKIFKEEL